ncbi:MAG: NAD-dependent deacylase [Planctomycetes bacterium]|nr:NAD-dependent deacylase [Planctomycetota bacterium]
MKPAVVVLTGAGASADSGVATFRGAGGLWEGLRVEDVATPAAWQRDAARVWRFYQERRAALARVAPNAAHHALVEIERRLAAAGALFTLVTQNVDDLHERAGSRNLVHMHGELAVLRCERCGARVRDLEHVAADAFVPCGVCAHARLRPDVVWFGEMPYHMEAIEGALEACTHFLAVGTSGVVYPAAGLLALARESGARTFVQSLEPPANVDLGDLFVPGRAAEALPPLLEDLAREWGLGA